MGVHEPNTTDYPIPLGSIQPNYDTSLVGSIQEINDRYLIFDDKILGYGGFSIVKEGSDKTNGRKVAVKVIERSELQHKPSRIERLKNEVQVLTTLGHHQSIVMLFEEIHTPDKVYLLFECMEGDLRNFLCQYHHKRGISEPIAQHIIRQLTEAVDFCHQNNIIHRDIKLENVLIDASSMRVVLGDFGFAISSSPQTKLTTWCGSPFSVSPEIVARQPYSGYASDCWSLGTVCYTLLCGRFPFQSKLADKVENTKEVAHRTLQGKFHPYPPHVSRAARDFVTRCLMVKPENRLTTSMMLHHPFLWTNDDSDDDDNNNNSDDDDDNNTCSKEDNSNNLLKS